MINLKFLFDMNYHCAYCFKELYGNNECDCEKSELGSKKASEINNITKAIEERYKNQYGIFYDEAKVKEFKSKNNKNYPPYW